MKDQHYQQHKLFVPQLPHKSTTTFLYYQTFFKLFLSHRRHLSFINVWRFFRRSLVRLVGCFTIPSNYPTKIRAISQKSSGKVSNVGKATKKVQISCVSPLWVMIMVFFGVGASWLVAVYCLNNQRGTIHNTDQVHVIAFFSVFRYLLTPF